MMLKINVAKDFNDAIGVRLKSVSDYSAEHFYFKHLKPKFMKALKKKEKLHLYMDGTWGYPDSFIYEAFGMISYKFGYEVKDSLVIHNSEDEDLEDTIYKAIKERDCHIVDI